jgi:hypothetical protein
LTGKFFYKEVRHNDIQDEDSRRKIENDFKKDKISEKKEFTDNHHCTNEEKYNFETAYDNLYNVESDFEEKNMKKDSKTNSMPQQPLIYHRTTNLHSFRGVNNLKESVDNNKLNNLQNQNDENKISHSIIEEKFPENSRSYDYLQGLNLNFDYSTISDYKNLISNTGANTINTIEYNQPPDNDSECKTINYSQNNFINNHALHQNNAIYDQNQIHSKNEKFQTLPLTSKSSDKLNINNIAPTPTFPKSSFKTIDSNQEENQEFKINIEQQAFSPLIIPKEDLVEEQEKKMETSIKPVSSNQNSLNNSYALSVKQGLRQKLKQGGRSSGQNTPKNNHGLRLNIEFENKLKTLQNSNNFNLPSQQLERNYRTIANTNTAGYKFETESDFNPSEEPRRDQLDTENSLPKIGSKQDAFKSRIQDIEKEIIISNLIKRINRNENLKQYIARQYGYGSFDEFMKRLNNNELNLERIEADLNFEASEASTKGRYPNSSLNKNSNFSQPSSLYIEDKQKILNKGVTPARPRSAFNQKDNKSKRDHIPTVNNPSPYNEPIKFENFLRSTMKVPSKPKSLANSIQRGGRKSNSSSLENKNYYFPNY